jgi:1,4-dihydroxy-2-naphthoyl-CoA hydrolase
MSTKVFSNELQIHFSQSDLGGISFFGNVYPMAHDAYERFVEHLGFKWKDWFANSEWGVPIRHSEADYHRPLWPGEKYQIQIRIERLGETSMTLSYQFVQGTNLHVEAKLVHAFVNMKTMTKIPIPPQVLTALKTYHSQSLST